MEISLLGDIDILFHLKYFLAWMSMEISNKILLMFAHKILHGVCI